jgi:molybdenum cofactor cytidylyltransferase
MSAHGAIVLAAGLSQRLGQPKQQLRYQGQTLEEHAVALAAATRPAELLLVRAGTDGSPLPALPQPPAPPLQLVIAPAGGMGRSLAAAVASSQLVGAGWLVLLVDQPGLDEAHLEALLRLWRTDPSRAVASAYADTCGVPAILPYSWRQWLLQLDGDQGARALLRAEPELRSISAPVLAQDLDEAEDLQRFLGESSSS